MNRLDQMDQMGDILGGGKRPRLEEGDAVWWSQTTERRLISVCQTIGLKYKSIHILVKIMFDVDFDDFDIDVLFEVYANVNDGFEAEVDV